MLSRHWDAWSPRTLRCALLWHLRLRLYVCNASRSESGIRGGVDVVSLQGTVKALTFFQSTANSSTRMVNADGESEWLARESGVVDGCVSVALLSHVCMVVS